MTDYDLTIINNESLIQVNLAEQESILYIIRLDGIWV